MKNEMAQSTDVEALFPPDPDMDDEQVEAELRIIASNQQRETTGLFEGDTPKVVERARPWLQANPQGIFVDVATGRSAWMVKDADGNEIIFCSARSW